MSSGIKYTTNEVIDILKDLGYILLDNEYINAKTSMNIEDFCGYRYHVRLGNLLSKKEPKPVSKFNPHSIYNIKKYIDINNLNVKLISDDFISEKDKLKFQCSCGNIYYCEYPKFKHRTKILCNECSLIEKGIRKRHSLDFIKNEFIKSGYMPMFEEYIHCEEKLLCKNKDGYIGELSYNNLSSGYKFQIFSVNNKYTIENIKNYIKINNLTCKLLSKTWISSTDELILECECGDNFYSTWKDFTSQNKTRCSACAGRKSKYALQFEEWANNNSINYMREYRIEECRYKAPLPFDYAIYINSELILCEIDGQHHYKPVECWSGEVGLIEQKIKDNIKTNYCLNNGIFLLRIPYWEFESGKYIKILNKKLLGNNL